MIYLSQSPRKENQHTSRQLKGRLLWVWFLIGLRSLSKAQFFFGLFCQKTDPLKPHRKMHHQRRITASKWRYYTLSKTHCYEDCQEMPLVESVGIGPFVPVVGCRHSWCNGQIAPRCSCMVFDRRGKDWRRMWHIRWSWWDRQCRGHKSGSYHDDPLSLVTHRRLFFHWSCLI